MLDARGDQYRFSAAQNLLDFGLRTTSASAPISEGREYEKGLYRVEETVGLVAAEDVPGLVGPGLEVERRTTTDEPPPEARAGEELGTVEVLVDGKSVGSALVTEKATKRPRGRRSVTGPQARCRASPAWSRVCSRRPPPTKGGRAPVVPWVL